ncbi:hypothetical protein SAMD00019534_122880, partial [Acytostelium subglobosum LB1]|uniref:hypothetical protein n=1 Tax=Acytostelium subglobosum LB1 TaxID=1410327 RepID=UPI0006448AB0
MRIMNIIASTATRYRILIGVVLLLSLYLTVSWIVLSDNNKETIVIDTIEATPHTAAPSTNSNNNDYNFKHGNDSVLFLLGNNEWGKPSLYEGFSKCGHDRNVLEFTYNRSRINEADGIFYFASDIDTFAPTGTWQVNMPHPDRQVKVLFGAESAANKNGFCFGKPSCIEYFNWTIYFLPYPHSDIIESYLYKPDFDKFYARELESPFDFEGAMQLKEPGRVASWFTTICNDPDSPTEDEGERVKFMRRVMNKMHVDSYGRCLHNKDEPPEGGRYSSKRDEIKIQVMKTYKFNFALENTNCPYYFTEKALHCLMNGIVPVYLGHETNLQYMPPGSYIYIKDFKNIDALVERLHYLDHNDTEYRKYFEWRENPETLRKWGDVFYKNNALCDLYSLYIKFRKNMDTFPRKHATADPNLITCPQAF